MNALAARRHMQPERRERKIMMRELVMERIRLLVQDHRQRAAQFRQPPRFAIPSDIETMSDGALLDLYDRVLTDSLPIAC